jgi:EAL domain-containing protein (putative c-di-GMP-specific phosphodiesterase class I)
VGFASQIGATIVAEGIETERQLEVLRALGIRCGQGYHLGRPEPVVRSARRQPVQG